MKKYYLSCPFLGKKANGRGILFSLLCAVLLSVGNTVFANDFNLILDNEKPLKEAFEEIASHTQYRFFYNSNEINLSTSIDYEFTEASIDEVMTTLLASTKLDYKVIGTQVLVFPKEEGKQPTNVDQEKTKVKGTVTDENEVGLPGVNVIIKGTTTGAITDFDGNYELEVATTDILIFSFVGYDNQEQSVGDRSIINVQLATQVDELEEVVVTAFGIEKEKKSIGYSVQEVKSDELTDTRTTNVGSNLSGKIAGVQVNPSGGLGGSVSVRVRGSSSISGNNEPLWVVDGVPINSSSMGQVSNPDDGPEWGGRNADGGVSDINPEDIANISVLKGPNAAALYGSRAQNGAIIITTKKGSAQQGVKVEYNANVMFEQVQSFYNMQDTYGQGTNGQIDTNAMGSWGAPMNGQMVQSWVDPSLKTPYQANQQYKDFFELGSTVSNNIAVSGGNELATFRMSFMDQRANGIFPSQSLNKNSIDFQGGLKTEKFTLNGKFNYINHREEGTPNQGYIGTVNQFVQMPRSIQTNDIKNNYMHPVYGHQVNWSGLSSQYVNPYWQDYNASINNAERDRFVTMVSAGYQFNDWLSLSAKTGLDYYSETRETRDLPSNQTMTDKKYILDKYNVMEMNSDIMMNANKQFGDWGVSASVGANNMHQQRSGMGNEGVGQIVPGLWSIPNSTSVINRQTYYEKEIQSVFAFGQFSFRNYVFIDWTARNDWSSTLPAENRSYFYPSIAGSLVVSDMLEDFDTQLPEWITYMKVRGSWAKVGNDTDPYMLAGTYGVQQGAGGPLVEAPLQLPLEGLKPEETTSKEFGAEMRFLKNRLYFDFTMYQSNTFNQILTVPMTSSSGYSHKIINAGNVENKGFEFMVNATVLEKRDFKWDIGFNFSKNRTYVNELADGVQTYEMANVNGVTVVAQEGQDYGNIRSKRSFVYDENGNKMIGNDGLPITSNDPEIIGNIQPDYMGSVSTTLNYKNVSFRAQVDFKKGGDIYSYTDALGTLQGTGERTLNGRDGNMVVEGVNAETGQPNDVKISSEQYWNHVGGANAVGSEFMYDASYISLRELSIGYSLPSKWMDNMFLDKVRVSAVGRNLFYFKTNMPGTSPESYAGPTDGYRGIEMGGYPMTRNFGFNVNVAF
ncbi:SusC/RagA family TonB-linked outer membrane protein [Flammeovirga kamogawensis]|uniref:SusC/RagA family TonB-linked outer membrane protein n=1 Tax=Flammeovirga kamogawensis TaxID=373891 RepID=A0ABX8H4J6_9BACT|nr:SusC/RagA family TonB-linked outer membrane protein [Flammeovirga kamogawensis]MBB6461919.1 TonB-linked SusC/RagA family outer membrane protein [Flammeovirga kamogawensis]QWG10472.1 SusC/RagA family TonB-linked outer membrane protein [Flammeovirga kamogawensis]TRX63583.1 SusC/RagA family TonB-linked outer membrane protein [Flammeovirga kamogawensis]